ncbi:hypothetical protein CEXT_103871 [Caerostris extrusa]|uniref:Uncharacterized protein n=1 Tax=Caerostris extrusa TaxID=172846 RepID=A0AAV4QE63_CAEEX|nr:hypothetical protein CEXT_103871 [Caerostris extrusa]
MLYIRRKARTEETKDLSTLHKPARRNFKKNSHSWRLWKFSELLTPPPLGDILCTTVAILIASIQRGSDRARRKGRGGRKVVRKG